MTDLQKHRKDSSGFKLSKWYLDSIDESGRVFIGYAAVLSWKSISLSYNNKLISLPNEKALQESRFKKCSTPEKKEGSLVWKDSLFNIKGQWKQKSSPLYARIFESDDGFLDWACYQPISESFVSIGSDLSIKGLGYAEQLTLAIEPWKIPLDQLRWGRFVSQGDSLVWIEIKSSKTKDWVWYNGERTTASYIGEDRVVVADLDVELFLTRRRVLEKEKKILQIVKALLAWFPGLNKIVKKSFLNANEVKWLSRGVLKLSGKTKSSGWVIHERVDFSERK